MNEDIEFVYIGWCHENNSDKVWTAFTVNGIPYAGWGRRGKTLRFKKHPTITSLKTVRNKKEKEYETVDEFQLFAIFPDFKEDVSSKLFFATLSDKVI